jgi:hypothetical protein
MSFIRFLLFPLFFVGLTAQAASSQGGFGINLGIGLPYTSQVGINYRFSDRLTLNLANNLFSLDVDSASLKLMMPELVLYYHPFGGSFFLGAGVGKEALDVTATETGGTTEVKIEVEATTTIGKIGWMWGVSDGGFWFGMDLAYIMPTSPKTTITAPGVATTNQAYIDAVDAGDKFGNTAYMNITFAKFGWLF